MPSSEVQNPLVDNELISNVLISGGGVTSFERIIGGVQRTELNSVKQNIDGSYIFCGSMDNSETETSSVFALKLLDSGSTVWITITNSANNASHVEITQDYGYIIASSSFGSSHSGMNWSKVVLIKMDGLGEVEWEKWPYGSIFETSTKVIQTQDQGYVFCAVSFDMRSAFLRKVNAKGTEIWQKQYPQNLSFQDVELTVDGGYITCGQYNVNPDSPFTGGDISKMNSNADTSWTNFSGNNPIGIAVTSSGYIAGGFRDSGAPKSRKSFIMSINETGNLIWDKEYNDIGITDIQDVQVINDNHIIAIGGGDSKAHLLKVNSTDGSVIWHKTFSPGNACTLFEVQQTSDEGFVAVGFVVKQGGNVSGYILKTDQNGN